MAFASLLLATFLIASLSLVGVTIFFFKQKIHKLLLWLVALSAGAMLGNATFHLLPEAFELSEENGLGLLTTMGIFTAAFVLSFLFEQAFAWHHCHTASHHAGEHAGAHCHMDKKAYAPLILLSDAIHNFIDGLILAAAFLVAPALGVATAIAIALHEIPQELGDYAVLLHTGMQKKRALVLNYLSATTVILGGIAGWYVSNLSDAVIPILMPFAAGSFLYIAASDLLPELKHEERLSQSVLHFLMFLIGLAIMIGAVFLE